MILPFFALGQSFDVVDSPAYYYVLAGQDTISRHTKESKAILKAAETSLNREDVVMLRPTATFSFSGLDLSNYYTKKEIDSINDLHSKIDLIQSQNYNKLKEELIYLRKRTNKIIEIIENRLKYKG